ncbi:type II secretion system F family protein [Desulfuribacillus alkaliarsenatis]|uniref:Type II secretion system protein GspF domain-containing protein n=1 Tax=Desulfuribacillus alkaliarsenatis TaxID=766136 RepID=A0A1E5G6N1_9FIRM|nr:type II secretion system F family protein [Desulfuribacillus alkaliarsenatis]OEF98404.1 hypothetical protein BHF68_01625 [Desulfuribacillus alkaliarsenatis]
MNKSIKNYLTQYRHNHTQLSEIASQLGELLDSGVDIRLAFYTLSKHARLNKAFKDMKWKQYLEEGKDLSFVFREYQFPFLFVSTIKAGEDSGRIVQSLYLLADHYEKLGELKNKISQALMYPLMILITVLFSFYFMLYFVLPNFKQLYHGLGLTVPSSTSYLFTIQAWLVDNNNNLLYVILGMAIVILLAVAIKPIRFYLMWLALYIPMIGSLFRYMNTHVLVMQLSMLIKGGISVNEAFSSIENLYRGPIAKEVNNLKQQVVAGNQISVTLSKMKCFDQNLVGFVELGEATGNLDSSFTGAEIFYNMRMKNLIQILLKSIEPAIILVLGIAVALIIVTMLLPLFDLLENI